MASRETFLLICFLSHLQVPSVSTLLFVKPILITMRFDLTKCSFSITFYISPFGFLPSAGTSELPTFEYKMPLNDCHETFLINMKHFSIFSSYFFSFCSYVFYMFMEIIQLQVIVFNFLHSFLPSFILAFSVVFVIFGSLTFR